MKMRWYLLGAIAAMFLLTGCGMTAADRAAMNEAQQNAKAAQEQAAAAAASAAASRDAAQAAADDAGVAATAAQAASEKADRIFQHGNDK